MSRASQSREADAVRGSDTVRPTRLDAPVPSPSTGSRARPMSGGLLVLQREAGNRAVSQLVHASRPGHGPHTEGEQVATPAAEPETDVRVSRQDTGAHADSPADGSDDSGEEGRGSWEPIVVSGSPQDLADYFTELTLERYPDRPEASIVSMIFTSRQIIVFRGRRRADVFDVDTELSGPLPSGLFRSPEGTLQQLVENTVTGERTWRGSVAVDQERTRVDIVVAADRERYRAFLGTISDRIIARSGARDGGSERAGEDGGQDGAQAGAGGGLTTLPSWARRVFQATQDRLRGEHRRVREEAGRDAQESDPAALARLRALAALPDRVRLGADGGDILMMVHVGEARGAFALRQERSVPLVWEQVQALTRSLLAGRRASRHASLDDLLLGGHEGSPASPDTVQPNTEPYPSYIRAYGPEVGVVGATQRFTMHLDWTVEGRWATFAAFGPRLYTWEVFELRSSAGAVAPSGRSRRVGPGESAGAELDRGFSDIGEDLEATAQEESVLLTAGPAALDAAVRSAGTLVSSFVTLASQPTNERGIQWQRPGTYVTRCTSARPPLSRDDAPRTPQVRAPSTAWHVMRVMTPQAVAESLTAPTDLRAAEQELARLQDLLAGAADDAERAEITAQLAAVEAQLPGLRAADEAGMSAHLEASETSLAQQIALAELVQKLQASGVAPERWGPLIAEDPPAELAGTTPDHILALAVGLHVDLVLKGRTAATSLTELRRGAEVVRGQLGALAEVRGDLQGPEFRPHMSFVPDADGRSFPLLTLLAELADSTPQRPRWVLIDLSTPGHHDRYEGTGSGAGPGGHAQAIQAAVDDFAGELPYGERGLLGIRMPASLADHIGGPVGVPQTTRSRPHAAARWRQRLESLATATAVAGLVVTGPVGVAIGVVGGIAGGAVAAYRIHRRHEGGYLEMNLETAMDITAIVGGAVAPAGVWGASVRSTSRLVRVADRVEHGVRVYGYLQHGGQIYVIPASLADELGTIAADADLSPGERSARRSLAFLNATRSGLEFVVGSHRSVEEYAAGPRVREPGAAPSAGDGPAARPSGEGPAARPASAEERPVSRPPASAAETPVDATGAPRRSPAEEGGEPLPRDASEEARATRDTVEDIMVVPFPDGTVMQAPEGHTTDRSIAHDMFESTYRDDPTREVGILRNTATGEFIIVQGAERVVGLGLDHRNWSEILSPGHRGRGRWVMEEHAHPVDPTVGTVPEYARWPSGGDGDFYGVVLEADMRGGVATEQIRWLGPHGERTTTYGYDPAHAEPYFVEVPGADGTVERLRFPTIEDYHDRYTARFGSPPSPGIAADFAGARRGTSDAPTTGAGTAAGARSGTSRGAPTRHSTPEEIRVRYQAELSPGAAHGASRRAHLEVIEQEIQTALADRDTAAAARARSRLREFDERMRMVRQAAQGTTYPAGFAIRRMTTAEFRERFAGRVPANTVIEFERGRVWKDPTTDEIVVQSLLGASLGSAGRREMGSTRRFEEHIGPRLRGDGAEASGPGEFDTEIAHATGPGVGFDSPYGLGRAPREINQRLQNFGIESALREFWGNERSRMAEAGLEVPEILITSRIRYDERYGDYLSQNTYRIEAVGHHGAAVLLEVTIAIDYDTRAVTLEMEPLGPGGHYAHVRTRLESTRGRQALRSGFALDDMGDWTVRTRASQGSALADGPHQGIPHRSAAEAAQLVDRVEDALGVVESAHGADAATPYREQLDALRPRIEEGDPAVTGELAELLETLVTQAAAVPARAARPLR